MKQLVLIGAQMANACYNLSQKDHITQRDRESLREMQQEWDKQLLALRENMKTLAQLFDVLKTLTEV